MKTHSPIAAHIVWPTELAPNSAKVVVVIDVLAATTNMLDFYEHGANVFLTNKSQIIRHYEELSAEREVLLVGEADSKTTETMNKKGLSFAASNSPIHIRAASFLDNINGRALLYLSNNGTRVINLAFENGAERVIAANFLNIFNVAELLLTGVFGSEITIVPSGEIQFVGEFREGEDMNCAMALQAILKASLPDLAAFRADSKNYIVDKYRAHGLSHAELEQHAELALYRPKVLEALRRPSGLIELLPIRID
jgi:phosphosulfolactate phosphohydrolase-like enzyme